MKVVTSTDVQAEMLRISGLLNQALSDLQTRSREWAEAERDYRKAIPEEWLRVRSEAEDRAEKLLAKEAEDRMKARTADARFRRDVAESLKVAALESVRSLRSQLSALMTVCAGAREEAALAGRYGEGA